MTYQQTVDYLYSQLPTFQNKGKEAVNWKLENIQLLCQYLNNPQDSFKSIHIAGTNGKGSSSHYLASILQEAGYKVGLYTSPHLKDFRERFRINGQLVHKNFVVQFIKTHKAIIEQLKPSFFEITVAMAFQLFANEKVDYAIIEVGLGGRLDSTNIINPIACLITNIGFDHMDMLGETLPEIASEKAGIIKYGIPVVISESHKETKNVFNEKAKSLNAPIFFAEESYLVKQVDENKTKFIVNELSSNIEFEIQSELSGTYQVKNLQGVLKTIDILRYGGIKITKSNLLNGLSSVCSNTNLKGRWQELAINPLTICDTGHNKEAFDYLLKYLYSTTYDKIHLILGFAKDKDPSVLLSSLPINCIVYYCTFLGGRSTTDFTHERYVKNINTYDIAFNSVNEALKVVRKQAGEKDFIFIGGSTYLVAELDEI
ncbi:dihydrofolate synthase / folylpolyglutamate synthase [Spirosomataceae bacterium TFI 002]|nr:dihydrofolate synthase / folylpolyglutamate synthase [Spirosomataceae bacterium TFI 002]